METSWSKKAIHSHPYGATFCSYIRVCFPARPYSVATSQRSDRAPPWSYPRYLLGGRLLRLAAADLTAAGPAFLVLARTRRGNDLCQS